MLDDVSPAQFPGSRAQSIPSPLSRESRTRQGSPRTQQVLCAARDPHESPKNPEFARFSAHFKQPSPDFLQPTKLPNRNSPTKQCSEPAGFRANRNRYDETMVGSGRQGEGSSQHMPSDPEKAYIRQSPRQSSPYCPSEIHHTTIRFDEDDAKDENRMEEHSVWILVSSSHCLDSSGDTVIIR